MEFISDVASGGDTGKPSLFEIIAQRKMNELLEPALRHVTSVCAHRYPRYLVRILNYHEEMFAAIMCIIEGYYLKNYGASFTEHFYGMKRERTRKINGVSAMTGGDRAKSLLFLVGLPLAKARLDQYYEKISGGAAARLLGQDFVDDEDAEETVRADADGQAGEHAARR
ncbi:ubiquitin-protein ligase peroxin 12, partial [Spiromyces aspiralis]